MTTTAERHRTRLQGRHLDGYERTRIGGLSSVLRVLWSFVRVRPGRWLLSVLSVGLGLSIAVAVVGLASSLGRPYELSIRGAGGGEPALLVLPAVQQRMPEDMLRTVRSLAGVDSASPFVIAPSIAAAVGQAEGIGVIVVGVDCSSGWLAPDRCTALGTALARAPRGAAPVVATPAAAAGLGVVAGGRISMPGGTAGEVVVASVEELPVEGLPTDKALVTDVISAQALIGRPGYLTGVAVRAGNPGVATDSIRAALGDRVRIGSSAVEAPVVLNATRQLLPLIGVFAALGGVLVVIGTFAIAAQQRMRSLATLSAIGAAPAHLGVALAIEAVVIGFAAAVLIGLPLGVALGTALTERVGTSLLAGSGLHPPFVLDPATVAVALVGGPVLGLVAMAPFLAGALRTPISQVLDGTAASSRERQTSMLMVGGILTLVGASIVVIPVSRGELPVAIAYAAIVAFAAGSFAVGFAVPAVVVRLRVALIERHIGAGAMLARADLRRATLRSGACVASVTMAVAIVVGVGNLRTFAGADIARRIGLSLGDDLWLSGKDPDDIGDARLTSALLDRSRSLTEIEAIGQRSLVVAGTGLDSLAIIGMDPDDTYVARQIETASVPTPEALDSLRLGGVWLSPLAASQLGARTGDVVLLPTPAGAREFRVGAVEFPIVGNEAGLAQFVVVRADIAEDIWGATPTIAIASPRGGRSRDAASALSSTGDVSTVSVLDAGAAGSAAAGLTSRFLAPFGLMSVMVFAVAAAAVTALLLVNVLQNRRERAMLRSLGISPALEWRIVFYEAAGIAAAGCFVGVVTGLWFSWLLSICSPIFLASKANWAVSWAWVGIGVLAGVGAAVLGAVVPAIEARRGDVAALAED